MPVFIYEATRKDGKSVKGTLNVPSVQMARIKLKSRNLEPVYVIKKPTKSFFAGGGGAKAKDLLMFTRQMAFLLSSGVSILRALNIVASITPNPHFTGHVNDLLKSLEGGESFSAALRKKPDVFKGFYVNMIVCAEETGLLAQTLADLAEYLERTEFIKSKVKSAMIYPAVVLSISLCIISGIIMFVVPKFEEIYGGAQQLPFLTQIFVGLSRAMRENWIILFGSLILAIIGLVQYAKTETGRNAMTSVIGSLPVFGKLQFQAGLAKFCRSFFSLSKSGVNLLETLDISGAVSGHLEIQAALRKTKSAVSQGKAFAYGLAVSRRFPPLVVNMVKVGEESGKLEKSFEKLTVFYEKELENTISALIKLIEPLLIVFLGGAIGTIILALYLPVFNLGNII